MAPIQMARRTFLRAGSATVVSTGLPWGRTARAIPAEPAPLSATDGLAGVTPEELAVFSDLYKAALASGRQKLTSVLPRRRPIRIGISVLSFGSSRKHFRDFTFSARAF